MKDQQLTDTQRLRNLLKPMKPCMEAKISKQVDALLVMLGNTERERDELLKMTEKLDEHPEGYDGPCFCKLCMSYAERG